MLTQTPLQWDIQFAPTEEEILYRQALSLTVQLDWAWLSAPNPDYGKRAKRLARRAAAREERRRQVLFA